MKLVPYSYQYIQRSWPKATCSYSSGDSVAIVIRIHSFKDMKRILFHVLYLKVRYYTMLFWQGKKTISKTKKEGKKWLCLWLQDCRSGWTSFLEFLPSYSYLCLLLKCPNKYWNSKFYEQVTTVKGAPIFGEGLRTCWLETAWIWPVN